jgi:hypothetical protein
MCKGEFQEEVVCHQDSALKAQTTQTKLNQRVFWDLRLVVVKAWSRKVAFNWWLLHNAICMLKRWLIQIHTATKGFILMLENSTELLSLCNYGEQC